MIPLEKRRSWPWVLLRVALGMGNLALFSLVFILLRPQFSTAVIALLYLIPVVISAMLWGLLPGIATSIVSFLLYNYFFLPPYYTFQVSHPQDILVMGVLLGVAILISSLMANIQANLTKAQAREREALQLYQLSSDLSGKTSQADIVNVLCRWLSEFFESCRVEVEVQSAGQTITRQFPPAPSACQGEPPRIIPLVSSHARLGDIRIWGLPEKISPEEERLLETFANQGALALDTAILSDSETRARILEESDRLKTAILSSVSHELRTPLATIQTAATSLFNPKLSLEAEAQSELRSLLLEETDRMVQLVGNLLNMSRIEAGALKLQRQWNSLGEIIDTCMQRLKRISSSHQIAIEIPDDLPFVWVDSVLMEQVIINLVSNSLKFAPPDTPISISAAAGEQNLTVTVLNQGPAIPADLMDNIFEKFYPVPGREASQGIGLGLSICKGIVEAHGGKIWAENLPNGVAFSFSLPLTREGMRAIQPEEGEMI